MALKADAQERRQMWIARLLARPSRQFEWRSYFLFGCAILLAVLLAAFGYFSTINNQKVEVQLYGPFSVQVSLWVLVLGTLVLGWLLTEIYLMIRHPDRWLRYTALQAIVKLDPRESYPGSSHVLEALAYFAV